MLIDTLMRDKRTSKVLHQGTVKRIRLALNSTKRYNFDASASDKLFELAVDEPETVCEFADTAIPPFKNTYIEIDYSRHPARPHWHVKPEDLPAEKIGYLYCDDGCVYVVSGDEQFAFLAPFVYIETERAAAALNLDRGELHRFLNLEGNPSNLEDIDYAAIKAILIAGIDPKHSDYHKVLPNVRKLTDRFDIAIGWDLSKVSSKHDETLGEILIKQAIDGSGAIRIATAAILLLNQRRTTTIYEKRAGSKMIHSKLVPLPAFNEVVIDLDAKHTTFHKLFSEGPKVRKREHDVSGYWSHYDCASQCNHQWTEYRSISAEKVDMEVHGFILKRQICTLCGGRRTHKEDHKRGDPALGRVEKTYHVTASAHRRKKKEKPNDGAS